MRPDWPAADARETSLTAVRRRCADALRGLLGLLLLLLLLLLRLAGDALAERVPAVLVRAVELCERLAAVRTEEVLVGLRFLRLALLGRAHLVLVLLIGRGLLGARVPRDALAVGVLAVLVGAVELIERLAAVRAREVLVRLRLLRLAVGLGGRHRLLIVLRLGLGLARDALAVRVLYGHLLGRSHGLDGLGERLRAA